MLAYTQQFIDSVRFMVSSSWKFVDNLANGIHKIKCKYGKNKKKIEDCGNIYRGCNFYLQYKRLQFLSLI